MNRKNLLVLAVIIAVIVLVGGATYYIRTTAIKEAQNEANKTLFSDEDQAVFLDSQSNPIELDTYENTVLVVNVWASWSPYTEIEFPILNEIATQYKDRGVKVLAMNRKENQNQIERYLASIPKYDNIEQIIDVNDFFYAGVDGYAMPETIIYDTDGKIIQHIRGVVVKSELETILNTILEQQ
ncbi:TlpA family protein disulfide reductase [Patescibacteria group bacterium]|nr:TlpA family protein disulfide reductase [Patescibacteria group bacterium]